MWQHVFGKRVRCILTGDKSYDRFVGTCFDAQDRDIGALAISEGHARDCPRFSEGRYQEYETERSRSLTAHEYCR